jgi:hypothetical protein
MPRTNLSLGNLFRAVSGSARTSQAVSIGGLSGGTANSSFTSFAVDSVTANLPTYTYIVESTSEAATFSFGTQGSLHGTKVGSVANNYTVSFDNANFSVGSATLGASPSFPITPASIAQSTYSEAQSILSMTYADGYNLAATGYGSTSTKTLYAVDVYNTINQPDFCLLFGTKITKADGSIVNVEDLSVGDSIKAWVPAGLPDEDQDSESDQVDWRFYMLETQTGSYQEVNVADIVFNFASGYYDLNNGLIKATGTHPMWVWDSEIEKYHFKNIEDILPGDLVVTYDAIDGLNEIEITDIEVITADVEIVTLNVENADVYLANGIISHNKGTTTQPFIPSSGLRMYLDPSKASSTDGTTTSDWLDLSGYNTGVRPAGVQNAAGITGTNPGYNNGASRKEKYFTIGGATTFWYKDRTTNINGGITQFDTTGLTYVTWIRATSFPDMNSFGLFQKKGADVDYGFSLDKQAGITQLTFTSNRHDGFGNNAKVISPSTNVWYQVALTVSVAAGSTIYLDTTNLGNQSISAFAATSSYNIFVGNNGTNAGYTQNGAYQQGPGLFYNRVLTSTEITQVYNYFSPTYK